MVPTRPIFEMVLLLWYRHQDTIPHNRLELKDTFCCEWVLALVPGAKSEVLIMLVVSWQTYHIWFYSFLCFSFTMQFSRSNQSIAKSVFLTTKMLKKVDSIFQSLLLTINQLALTKFVVLPHLTLLSFVISIARSKNYPIRGRALESA